MPRRASDRDEADEIAKRVGERTRAARTALEITQEELSEKMGITAEALGRIERGVSLPSFPTFMKLCAALGRPPDALLLADQPRLAAAPSSLKKVPKPIPQLVRSLERLDARQQRVVLTVSRELSRYKRKS